MNARPLYLMAPLMVLAACGGRTLPGGAFTDGGAAVADGAAAPQCVIAIRTDNCCVAPVPATMAQVQQDPCLVSYPASAASITAACKKKMPKMCEVVDCDSPPPPSRLVQVTPGGGCGWMNECRVDSDCAPARDARQCCGCGAGYPVSLVSREPCLHDMRLNHPAPSHCTPKGCDGVKCKPCPGVSKATCLASSVKGINRCTPFRFWHK